MRTCRNSQFATVGTTFNETMMVIKGNSITSPFNLSPNASVAEFPYGIVEAQALFDEFKVNKCRLRIRTICSCTDDMYIMVICLRTATVFGTDLSFAKICEYPRMIYKLLSNAVGTSVTSRQKITTITFNTSAKSMFKGTAFTNDKFAAAEGAEPANGLFFHVILTKFNGNTLSVGMPFQTSIQLDQWVAFQKREQL